MSAITSLPENEEFDNPTNLEVYPLPDENLGEPMKT